MPQSLEKEEDALQRILSRIEEETLDPAKEEAEKIITDAKRRAEEIINHALKEKEHLLHQAKEAANKEKSVAHASLAQAGSEGVEAIRQKIQEGFFEKHLYTLVDKKLQENGIIEKIIDALLDALKKEGINSRFSLILPKAVSSKELSEVVAKYALTSLESDASLGNLSGGVQIKLKDKHLLLDFSSKAIFDLLVSYVRSDLRTILFGKDVG